MKTQGDTKRPRSVKAEFENDFCASAHGGAVLVEKALRSLRLWRILKQHLPARSDNAKYSMEEAASPSSAVTFLNFSFFYAFLA